MDVILVPAAISPLFTACFNSETEQPEGNRVKKNYRIISLSLIVAWVKIHLQNCLTLTILNKFTVYCVYFILSFFVGYPTSGSYEQP